MLRFFSLPECFCNNPVCYVANPYAFSSPLLLLLGGIGTVAVGRIETGVVRPGMRAYFAPAGVTAEIKSVERHHECVDEAIPGDSVGFNVKGISIKDLRRGFVASDANNEPASAVSSFEAQVIVTNHPGKISNGYTPIFHCHTSHVGCKFADIKEKIDPRSGELLEKSPKFVETGDACIVEMVPAKPLCVEPFSEFAPLGRFVLRDSRRIVAVGIVRSTTKVENNEEKI